MRAPSGAAVYRRGLALLLAVTLCATLTWAPRARATGDPTLQWETWSTKHFRVHSYRGLQPVAERVAEVCESVHERIAEPMGWDPTQITHVVLTDNTDYANGSATALPYNTVRLYVSGPDDISTLSDYDDWIVGLVTHEYTHVLHTDHITGVPAIVNALLGKTFAPNQAQPHWILEGLAVLMESRFTTAGRMRSSIFDMYLRADVLENNFAPIDRVSNSTRRWPQGDLWYLYGSRFLGYVSELYGYETLRQIAHDYGSEIIPFGINRAVHRATGKTYVELWDAWHADVQRKYEAQRSSIVARGLREGRRITFAGQEAQHPRYVPVDGAAPSSTPGAVRSLVYYRNDGHSTPGLYQLDLAAPAGLAPEAIGARGERLLTRTAAAATPARLADGSFVYDSVEASKMRLYYFNELFWRGPEDFGAQWTQGQRLSTGLRAREPSVSPDGKRIAYVINKAGTSYLYQSELERDASEVHLGPPKKLLASAPFEQVFTPRWSPDGRFIVYSAWRRGGYRDIEILDVQTGAVHPLTHDRAVDTGPVFSPDSKRVFFSSDRTGVPNIYAIGVDGSGLQQVSNVVNGALQPDVTPDGKHLVYVGYTHEGFDLFEMPLQPEQWLQPLDYVDSRGPMLPEPRRLGLTPTRYDPLPSLRPYSWMLEFKPDGFGNAMVLSSGGADAVGRHSFAASLTVNLERGVTGTALSYSYNMLPFATRMGLSRTVSPRRGMLVGDKKRTYAEEAMTVESGITVPLSSAFASQSLSLSYAFSQLRSLDALPIGELDPDGPMIERPLGGFLGSLRAGWSWSNAQSFLWSVGPAKGLSLAAGLEVARPEFASSFAVTVFSASGSLYLPMPWLSHHVLALHAEGGAGMGDFGRRGVFGLGGFSDVSLPVALRSVLIQPGVALRGYSPASLWGNAFLLFNAEYRFPVANVDRGLLTLPIFVRRLFGNVYADYGNASYAPLDLLALRGSVGAELLTELSLGYYVNVTVRLGLAKGFASDGIWQPYAVLSNLF